MWGLSGDLARHSLPFRNTSKFAELRRKFLYLHSYPLGVISLQSSALFPYISSYEAYDVLPLLASSFHFNSWLYLLTCR